MACISIAKEFPLLFFMGFMASCQLLINKSMANSIKMDSNYQDFEYFQFFIVICHQVKVVDILVLAIHQIHRLEVNQNIILMARGHHYLLSVNKQSFN